MIYIYGAGGHGKVVFHTLTQQQKTVTAFVDDNAKGKLCGISIITLQKLQSLSVTSSRVHIAIGNNTVRAKLQTQLHQAGINPETAIHPRAFIYSGTQTGVGSLITAGSIIGPDAHIGQGCIINHHATVDHDCYIGDFCHIAPAATLGGGVTVGAQSLIGAGATLLPYITLGEGVTVGAGAVVTHDLPDGITVTGCPAKPFIKH